MKRIFRGIVLWLLKKLAKRRLKKFRGKIIGVTGSIGKTSTKEAIFSVLNSQFKVKKTNKSMNSEFGLPLTILDVDSGYSSAIKWSYILFKAIYHSLLRDHSEILLLELGVDKPGDMDFLTSVVVPDIAVFTNVFPVHLDKGQFDTLKDIFEEKSKLIHSLKKGGHAVLNMDNEYTKFLAKRGTKYKWVTFGKDNDSQYKASDVHLSEDGVSFVLRLNNKYYEVKSKVLGEYHVYVLLPAIICGVLMGMRIEDSIKALERYSLPPGRLSVIPGINESVILDSSYNSSPEPLKEAMQVLTEIAGDKRRIAVLGSMNELGEKSAELHESIGEIIPQYVDILLTVGQEAKLFAKKALENGLKNDNVFSFETASDAAQFFKEKIKKGDTILVKGSQNKVRLERFLKEVMAFPEDAKKLLVRQEDVWQDII